MKCFLHLCVAFALLGLAATELAAAGGRRLVPLDVIQIRVVGQPDLDTQARIEPDGTIAIPYVGRIRAAGLSEDELADRIKRALEQAGVVTKPQVLVTNVNFGTQISVQGAVGAPGVVVLDRPTTLIQALSRAGGVRMDAGDVVIRRQGRDGRVVARVDAKALLKGNTNERDLLVQNNDEIYVEEAAVYYLYGYVNKPGQYPLTRKLTVQQGLAIGGGVSELGTDWFIRIRRRLPDGQVVEAWVSRDDQLQPNDTIVISQRLF